MMIPNTPNSDFRSWFPWAHWANTGSTDSYKSCWHKTKRNWHWSRYCWAMVATSRPSWGTFGSTWGPSTSFGFATVGWGKMGAFSDVGTELWAPGAWYNGGVSWIVSVAIVIVEDLYVSGEGKEGDGWIGARTVTAFLFITEFGRSAWFVSYQQVAKTPETDFTFLILISRRRTDDFSSLVPRSSSERPREFDRPRHQYKAIHSTMCINESFFFFKWHCVEHVPAFVIILTRYLELFIFNMESWYKVSSPCSQLAASHWNNSDYYNEAPPSTTSIPSVWQTLANQCQPPAGGNPVNRLR